MAPFSRVADPRLQGIAEALIERVHPGRIILFGSRARGDARADSDYDLFVEMDFEDYRESYNRVQAACRQSNDGIDIDVVLGRPGELEARRDDVACLEWDVARDGIVIYPAGCSSAALRPVPRARFAATAPPTTSRDPA